MSIAITGISAITSAGTGVEPLISALREGRSYLHPVPEGVAGHSNGLLWGAAKDFKASDFIPPLKARKLDRASQLAVATVGLALKDAGITREPAGNERIGIALGCGFGGIANSADFLAGYFESGIAGLTPLLFPNTVANAPASNASIEHGLKGPNMTFVQRFCSAESALFAACQFIEEGRADIMVVGGVDELTPLMMEGFSATGQLRSHAASFGEGAGILVIEDLGHARGRGAAIKGVLESVRTVGMLIRGAEKEAAIRLLPEVSQYDLISVSGSESSVANIFRPPSGISPIFPGRIFGYSLAMGGVSMAMLASILEPGKRGIHLAASPEGPYFSVEIMGVEPA